MRELTKPVRVLTSAWGFSDYSRYAYAQMADRVELWHATIEPGRWVQNLPALAEFDVFHMHWPEWMPLSGALQHERFISDLASSSVAVVLTQHNLQPHSKASEESRRIYSLWAKAADVVLHHSPWGMEKARGKLAYRPSAQHAVMPFPPFGYSDQIAGADVDEVGSHLSVAIVGAPRRQKRVDLVFAALELIPDCDVRIRVTQSSEVTRSADPRVMIDDNSRTFRRDYVNRIRNVDAFLAPFEPEGMLSSGVVGDSLGLGIPIIGSSWEFLKFALGDKFVNYGDNSSDNIAMALKGTSVRELNEMRLRLKGEFLDQGQAVAASLDRALHRAVSMLDR